MTSLRGFDVSDIGLTLGGSMTDLITLFTNIDDNTFNITLPAGQFKIFNNFYSNICICSNGWLSLYGATEVSYGLNNQHPINTLRFFGQDQLSTIKYKYDTVGDLLLFFTGYYYFNSNHTFDISLKITKLGLIYVKYNNISILYTKNPIIGWVGSNSSISRDDIFYNDYNGSKALTKIANNLSLELVGKTVLFCSAIDAKNALPATVNTLGFTPEELSKINFTLADLKAANFSATDLKNNGFTATDLKAANFSVNDLKSAGFTASQISRASTYEMKHSGFSISQMTKAGYSAFQFKAIGINASILKNNGFTIYNLKDAGFTIDKLKLVFTRDELLQVFTSAELL